MTSKTPPSPDAQDEAINRVESMPNIHKLLPENAYILGFIDGAQWQSKQGSGNWISANKLNELVANMEAEAKSYKQYGDFTELRIVEDYLSKIKALLPAK